MATRLETLIEQTDFLIEKQKEAQVESEKIFDGLLNEVEEKLNSANISAEDKKTLDLICTMIKEHTEKVVSQMQDDVDFLNEQLKMLKHIASVSDQAKSKELLGMMIDDSEELLETEEFKENLIQDSTNSKQSLIAIIDDLTSALKENKFKDVALFLEALCSEEVTDEDDGEDDDSEDDDCGCCESKCNKKSKCCSGVDIFKCCDDNDCNDDCCK